MPSILWVGMAFETPAMATGLVALVLYVVKVILYWREPRKRLHLKAAYLTFAALAGQLAALQSIGVIGVWILVHSSFSLKASKPVCPS